MSEFAHCLMMAAIYSTLTELFTEGNYETLDSIEVGLVVQDNNCPSDDVREAQALAVRMIDVFELYGEASVRRAHGTMPVV